MEKTTNNEARYDIVRMFTREYALGMGIKQERVAFNLTWEQAEIEKDNMNLYHLDDCTSHFFIEASL